MKEECKDKDWDGEGTLSFDDGIKLVNDFRRNKPWDAKEFEDQFFQKNKIRCKKLLFHKTTYWLYLVK